MSVVVYSKKEETNKTFLQKGQISFFENLKKNFELKSKVYYERLSKKEDDKQKNTNAESTDKLKKEIFEYLGCKDSDLFNKMFEFFGDQKKETGTQEQYFKRMTRGKPDEIFKEDLQYIKDNKEKITFIEKGYFEFVLSKIEESSLRTYDSYFDNVIKEYNEKKKETSSLNVWSSFDIYVKQAIVCSMLLKLSVDGTTRERQKKLLKLMRKIKGLIAENEIPKEELEKKLGFSYITGFVVERKKEFDNEFNSFVRDYFEMFIKTKKALLDFLLFK